MITPLISIISIQYKFNNYNSITITKNNKFHNNPITSNNQSSISSHNQTLKYLILQQNLSIISILDPNNGHMDNNRTNINDNFNQKMYNCHRYESQPLGDCRTKGRYGEQWGKLVNAQKGVLIQHYNRSPRCMPRMCQKHQNVYGNCQIRCNKSCCVMKLQYDNFQNHYQNSQKTKHKQKHSKNSCPYSWKNYLNSDITKYYNILQSQSQQPSNPSPSIYPNLPQNTNINMNINENENENEYTNINRNCQSKIQIPTTTSLSHMHRHRNSESFGHSEISVERHISREREIQRSRERQRDRDRDKDRERESYVADNVRTERNTLTTIHDDAQLEQDNYIIKNTSNNNQISKDSKYFLKLLTTISNKKYKPIVIVTHKQQQIQTDKQMGMNPNPTLPKLSECPQMQPMLPSSPSYTEQSTQIQQKWNNIFSTPSHHSSNKNHKGKDKDEDKDKNSCRNSNIVHLKLLQNKLEDIQKQIPVYQCDGSSRGEGAEKGESHLKRDQVGLGTCLEDCYWRHVGVNTDSNAIINYNQERIGSCQPNIDWYHLGLKESQRLYLLDRFMKHYQNIHDKIL